MKKLVVIISTALIVSIFGIVYLGFFQKDNGEITDVSQTETALRRAAIKRGIKAIFLCDSSKAGKIYPHHVCYKSEIAEIITDSDFPREYL